MNTSDPEFEAYKKRVKVLLKRLDKTGTELQKTKKEFKDSCTHPEQYHIRKEHNTEGGYYDRSTHNVWYECSRCGTQISEVKTTYGYYS